MECIAAEEVSDRALQMGEKKITVLVEERRKLVQVQKGSLVGSGEGHLEIKTLGTNISCLGAVDIQVMFKMFSRPHGQ